MLLLEAAALALMVTQIFSIVINKTKALDLSFRFADDLTKERLEACDNLLLDWF